MNMDRPVLDCRARCITTSMSMTAKAFKISAPAWIFAVAEG